MYLANIGALLLATGTFVSAAKHSNSNAEPSSTKNSILPVQSPSWMPDFPLPKDVRTSYPTSAPKISRTLSEKTLNLDNYPEPWTSPDTNSTEIKAVINAIDWTKVPKAPIRKAKKNGDLDMTKYDTDEDPYCWWSNTNCVEPKAKYLPEDITYCPRAGDWGLNYDDGPFNLAGEDELDKWAEPELYNFLAKNNNQKATLFYIGSNVATYPAAARRALNDGHVLCVHTWSHPQMTTQTNEQVVAELYWTLRAIKEATGVTTKCWRPPYGDVDDRVRAIAHQMGLQTMIWDEDTNDWDMFGEGGGMLPTSTVDGYFAQWIKNAKKKSDTHGHIVLQHELNNATVKMAEKWLPKLQENFNVVTIQQCMNITQPYWEENWVYPTEQNPIVANSTASATDVESTYDSEDKQATTSSKKEPSRSATHYAAATSIKTDDYSDSDVTKNDDVSPTNNIAMNAKTTNIVLSAAAGSDLQVSGALKNNAGSSSILALGAASVAYFFLN